MNYPYPIPGQQSNMASFCANVAHDLGDYNKRIDEVVVILVDYSWIIPALTLVSCSFVVTPGGMPELIPTMPAFSGSPLNHLSFNLSGGIGGINYALTINMHLSTGEVRSDTLNVNVIDPNEGCC